MKVLDASTKVTGFFVTTEILNLTKETIEPYYLVLEFYKDGYLKSKSTGSSLYETANYVTPGLKAKIEASTYSEGADKLIVRFPKPGWAPITLDLK